MIGLVWALLVSFVFGISSTPLLPSIYFVLLYTFMGINLITLTGYLVIVYNRLYRR